MNLWKQFLYHPAQGLVNCVVVNASQVVPDKHFLVRSFATDAELLQQPPHVLTDLVERVKFLLVLLEHVGVHFVDEHFERDGRVDCMGHFYDFEQLVAGHILVLLVSINHIDQ